MSIRTRFFAAAILASLVACASPEDNSVELDGAELNAASCVAQTACKDGGGPGVVKPNGHRVRDQIYAVGEEQWVIGKFVGLLDRDLKGEPIEVHVQQGCAGAWKKLGTTKTSVDGKGEGHAGVRDDVGRAFFRIAEPLPVGRHRVRLVTADKSYADGLLDIVPAGTPVVVTDVDGTLTSSEEADKTGILGTPQPEARANAAAVLSAFASKGYRIVYLTARSELKMDRTREFIEKRGFPAGIVNVSPSDGIAGDSGDEAYRFKLGQLKEMTARGLKIAYAFGNRATDVRAFGEAGIEPASHRVFVPYDDDGKPEPGIDKVIATLGGRYVASYAEMLPVANAEAPVCSRAN